MNVLIFGPNGSGKGTQGARIQERYAITHVESGVIFRKNIGEGTELGKAAKAYIDRGELVPDEITIPMILDRLKEADCAEGWLLDGFPRNPAQGEALMAALRAEGIKLDCVIEIVLPREVAKLRITGRRICKENNNHPNHIAFDAIKPAEKDGQIVCRVCGGELFARADDQDDAAIDKRHDIYYDATTGTMASVNYFKGLGEEAPVISVDGGPSIQEVSEQVFAALADKA